MLQTTLPAYLYQQYAADDNLQAVIEAYNAATQTIITAFATQNLAYYPGLSAPLLQWVAQGLYDSQETSLASPITPATGPLNTVMLNTTMLNAGTPASETFYNITDDVFKRILTWNLYKGDGKRFCMRWLKRRIARFIFGVEGVDPQPINNPDFIPGTSAGTESTWGISAEVSSHTLTVTLNQALLSAQTQLTPGILTFFQLAFTSGVLDLPLQYSYAVDLITMLSAAITPSSITQIGSAANQTTGNATVALAGGSGDYTYAWSAHSGGTGITIGSDTAATTDFSATGLATGAGVSGVFQCVVTDTITSDTATAYVTVVIERAAALTATASPTSLSASGASTAIATAKTTVTPAGGIAPYTYAFSFASGGADLIIEASGNQAYVESTSALPAGTTGSGVMQCVVTDHLGSTYTVDIDVSVTRVSAITATVSPGSASVVGASASEDTNSVTVTPSGGGGAYTYSWAFSVGGASIVIATPSAASTYFGAASLAAGTTRTGTAICTIKDQYGQSHVTAGIPVSIERVSLVTATVSPNTQTSSEKAATQTTGLSTVTASGGSGAYTYAWIFSSGGTHIEINSPSAKATSFTATGLTEGQVVSGIAQCTIRDAYGQTAVVTVSVSITYSFTGSAVIAWGTTTTHNPPITVETYGYTDAAAGTTTGALVSSDIFNGTLAAADSVIVSTGSGGTVSTNLIISTPTDPGQNFFATMVTPFGNLASSAASYSYNPTSHLATWTWSGSTLWASGVTGTHYAITLE